MCWLETGVVIRLGQRKAMDGNWNWQRMKQKRHWELMSEGSWGLGPWEHRRAYGRGA